MMPRKYLFISMVSFALAASAHADLPLSLEGIAPEQNRFEAGLSLSYYNRNHTSPQQGKSLYFATPQNTLIEIPGFLEEGRSNSDILYANADLQYGLTSRTELYASLGGFFRHSRHDSGTRSVRQSHSELSNFTIGVNHVFLNDGKNPALIGVLETSVYEKRRSDNAYGKSWFAGFNIYKAIDPIVFSFDAGYRFHASYQGHKPGDYFLLRPGVSFAANDRSTFSARFKWIGRQPDKHEGKRQGSFASDSYLTLGVGYAFSDQTSIRADVEWHLSGDEGGNATLALRHKF